MTIDTVKCPFCSENLIPSYIDIGDVEQPTFILGLTCDCVDWLDLEMNKTQAYSDIYGAVDYE